METKTCAVCGSAKPIEAFPKRAGKAARRGTCRACQRRRRKKGASGPLGPLAPYEPGPEVEPASPGAGAVPVLPPGDGAGTGAGLEGETVPLPAGPAKRKRKRRRRGRKGRAADGMTAAGSGGDDRSAIHIGRPPFKRIVPFRGPFSFDVGLLNDKGTGMIRLRGRRETGKRWQTEIETEVAIRMVREGAAGIVHPRLIHKLYTKSDFRLLILQRDGYTCRYCGRYGDTIDHVLPKSKGGLSTPQNCVCACSACNLKKADHLDFAYDDEE
ncbi:HNH endonuclease [Paenibacillus cisolokensis]|uniref:HNH endonuclease n=1 Tax=Paenibacillus cisolokensis TaxID=1658519 RepID=UPI003D283C22